MQDAEDSRNAHELGHGEGVGRRQPGVELVVVRPGFDEQGHGRGQVGGGEQGGGGGRPGADQGAAVVGEFLDPLDESGPGGRVEVPHLLQQELGGALVLEGGEVPADEGSPFGGLGVDVAAGVGAAQPFLAGTAEDGDLGRLTGVGRLLQPYVEQVGEFGGHRVRRPVEHGERDEEGLVVQRGRTLFVAEPARDLGGHRLLAVGGEFLLVDLTAVEGDEPPRELLDPARLLLSSQELRHRHESAQPRPRGLPEVPGDMGAQHVLGRGRLPAHERDVLQGGRRLDRDHQVAVGAFQLLAQTQQMGFAQRVAAAGGQVEQNVSGGVGQLLQEYRERGGRVQAAHPSGPQPQQEHEGRGTPAGVLPTGQDHDPVGAQPGECLVETRAAVEDVRQLLDLFLADLPGEVLRASRGPAEVVVHVALDGAAADAEKE
ncbi:hypothetical protein [Streptomyces sp. WM6386]|uniref:hypothetical protein n=1 Tax=Streptomyces sp. WM6386 TaxID=1415558 RepID=UPI001F20E06E|nr:hypothetical protein [Streptomyces sp. WM6386]